MVKKITIISPCYNGETHLEAYINGLFSQTYTNVEYIFINDGSTDNTENIIKSYEEKFKNKGWDFIYIKQEKRGGQAKAINQGLKIFTGDYLCCIDTDDILLPKYLEDMSNCLNENEEFGIVFPWVECVEENTEKHICYYKRNIPNHVKDTLFDDILLQRNKNENFIFFPSFMLRTNAFLDIYPNRKIYEGLSGQNAQLILPVIYNYKIGYVKQVLYKAIRRENSDSNLNNVQDFINKTYSWEDIYCNVINIIPNMPTHEKVYYFTCVKNYWEKVRKNCTTTNPDKTKHKVINIFGIKIKFRCKN